MSIGSFGLPSVMRDPGVTGQMAYGKSEFDWLMNQTYLSDFDMKNLLLVDDEKIFLRSLSEGLGTYLNSDVHIMTAENGEEAFRILSSVPVSLVVTDLKMPIMNGFELVSHMRESGFDIPVIVMSALLGGGEEGKLRSLGVSQFLEKPLDIEDLARLITEQLFDNYSTPPKGSSSSVPAIRTG